MMPIEGMPILTAAEMRAAEDRAIAAGASVASLMKRAGAGVAEAVRRLAAGGDVLVLCGPGNNGGDGYVAARVLRANGVPVRVAALADPATDAARAARLAWDGPVAAWEHAAPAAILVDAVFGTGMSRALDAKVAEQIALQATSAMLTIAVDLPSGVDSDTGAMLGAQHRADVTLALANPKPAHLLGVAAPRCGEVRVIDIGLTMFANSRAFVPRRPFMLRPPGTGAHKYSRGMVAVVGGAMPGATELAAQAALAAGAGYALLLGESSAVVPHAVVRARYNEAALRDPRIGAIVIGPGLGRDEAAGQLLDAALATAVPLIIDGDALHLLDAARLDRISRREAAAVLTPHAGEFDALFGTDPANRIARALAAADRSGAVIVFKGSSTVLAAPGCGARATPPASSWLSTAGTGDVLAGTIAAVVAGAGSVATMSFLIDLVAEAVWLHGTAARQLRGPFLADDLIPALSAARATL